MIQCNTKAVVLFINLRNRIIDIKPYVSYDIFIKTK